MPARKPSNSRSSRGTTKKTIKRAATAKPAPKKMAAKRTRRASETGPQTVKVKAPVPPPVSSTKVQAEPERKPAKKVEVRPPRPPAVLPIPQATFFF